MNFNEFLKTLSNPAQQALEVEKVDSYEKLTSYSEKELLALHGLGPKTIRMINDHFKQTKMSLRED